MTEELYEPNLAAMYYSFTETLGEYVDMEIGEELPQDEFERLILKAFESNSILGIDIKKMDRSFVHYMQNLEDLTSYSGYGTETPAFDEWIEI